MTKGLYETMIKAKIYMWREFYRKASLIRECMNQLKVWFAS